MFLRPLAAVAVTAGLLATGVGLAGPASAAPVEYVPGKDVTIGSCKGWLNKRTADGYIQAVGQSWTNSSSCEVWLERKRTGSGGYDWTRVSDKYWMQNSYASTGFHWNGTNAGSRVCVYNSAFGVVDKFCGEGAW